MLVMIWLIIVLECNVGDQKIVVVLLVLVEMLVGFSQILVLVCDLVLFGKVFYVDVGYDGLLVDLMIFVILLVFGLGVSNVDVEVVLDVVLQKFLIDGFDLVQLEWVKMQIQVLCIYVQDLVYGCVYDYGQGLFVGLIVQDVNDWFDIFEVVIVDDICVVVKLVLDSCVIVIGWLLFEGMFEFGVV